MLRKLIDTIKRAWRRYGFGACVITLCAIVCALAIGYRTSRSSANRENSARRALADEIMPAPTQSAIALVLPAGGVLRAYAPFAPVWSETLSVYEAHEGIDFAPGEGSLVYACMAGEVAWVGDMGVYGLCVKVNHAEGRESLYASLASARVSAGDKLRAGQPLGVAGVSAVCERALGAHLHFEWRVNGCLAEPKFIDG